jgi:hypothetical protein
MFYGPRQVGSTAKAKLCLLSRRYMVWQGNQAQLVSRILSVALLHDFMTPMLHCTLRVSCCQGLQVGQVSHGLQLVYVKPR